MKRISIIISILMSSFIYAQDKSDWQGGVPEGCTTITVGKLASQDGSVFTSHTDDSHRTRSWANVVPAQKHPKGSVMTMYKREACDTFAMPTYAHKPIGEIPQALKTYQFLNTAYPSLNEKQLAIGESTIGGREELQSDAGLIDCQRLVQIMLERCTTAREAILLADSLTKKYGWNDFGECLTIADPEEVWHFEIFGSGKGKIGAVWAARRVPDQHISVNANASTIKTLDLKDQNNYLASANVLSLAEEMGFYNPKKENFQFAQAYAPKSRWSLASRRREWRVFNLLAPSLKLDPNAEDFPFSVKPDKKVSIEDLIMCFQDYYENTDFDMTKNLTVQDENGKMVKSPLANPFMPYDANKLHKINGGWGWLGERTIARWYTMYGTIIQLRSDLPDEIGGVAWLAMDNIATSVYIPVYSGTTDLSIFYKTPGRTKGYTRQSAWWAFNRLGTLTAQRWGEARYDVEKVFKPLQKQIIKEQKEVVKKALATKSLKKRKSILTQETIKWGDYVVKKAWEMGDAFWTKYDEKF